MDLMKEITTAFKFVTLLYLLFWSWSWNLPTDYDPFQNSVEKYPYTKRQKDVDELVECNSKNFLETFEKLYKVQRSSKASSSKVPLPAFYTWKQRQLIKQEANLQEDSKNKFGSTSSRRKLNYASSKCGAKILSSNPEASHKTAILNENFEEYMLNPCRATIWFVLELCDTIEATQIELANYELYSSSPKRFSVFWSNIYPPKQWLHLGSFEAKDQRTMQTYNLTAHNYGKFLKVLILSHYGREHFCPISVLRVLGYSMIYEYEDLEVENKTSDAVISTQKRNHTNLTKDNAKGVKPYIPPAKTFKSLNCINRLSRSSTKRNETPSVQCMRFLQSIAPKAQHMNTKRQLENSNLLNSKKVKRRIKNYRIFKSIILKYSRICPLNVTGVSKMNINKSQLNQAENPPKQSFLKSENSDKEIKTSYKRKLLQETRSSEKSCVCDETSLHDTATVHKVTQSAALIQKESVITKLTHRIKYSETNLNFINQYLQQLSESYRQEMENIQSLLNGTLKAVGEAERKSSVIDEQRRISIKNMEVKMSNLNRKVEYFLDGHHLLLKWVMELHGLFLLLELIVMSTIFSIFVNHFKQKFPYS